MNRQLKLILVTKSNRTELGYLQDGEVIIGREPAIPNSLKIPNNAISRQHGTFKRFKNHWFYSDLGSTNGSWLNSEKITEKDIKLVRSGDVLQVADSVIEIEPASPESNYDPTKSLITFKNKQFFDEYPVEQQGKILSLGGLVADISVEGYSSSGIGLTFEFIGGNLTIVPSSKDVPARLNDKHISQPEYLKDLDKITFGDTLTLVNIPPRTKPALQNSVNVRPSQSSDRPSFEETASPDQAGRIRTPSSSNIEHSGTTAFRNPSSTFGKMLEEVHSNETVAVNPTDAQMHISSYREGLRASPSGSNRNKSGFLSKIEPGSLEFNLMIFTAVCLLGAFALFLYQFIFS